MPYEPVKPVRFLGDSLQQIKSFPVSVRKEAGVELHKVQQGIEPNDWKPMTSIGSGVREIRTRDESGAFRVLYIANQERRVCAPRLPEDVRDLDLAASRLKQI